MNIRTGIGITGLVGSILLSLAIATILALLNSLTGAVAGGFMPEFTDIFLSDHIQPFKEPIGSGLAILKFSTP